MAQMVSKEYESEWQISTLENNVFKIITTPIFSPLPHIIGMKFRFEAFYQEKIRIAISDLRSYSNNQIDLSLFKLKLVKFPSSSIPSALEFTIKVNVYYSDRCLFKEYSALSRNVDTMNEVCFDDVIVGNNQRTSSHTAHLSKMQYGNLILKCKMSFTGFNQTPQFTTRIQKSLNKHADFVKNLKAMQESSMLCDFTFEVGDKSFSAHKFILVAHSSVFKSMMTHEFLESKTNSVTITDIAPEIFFSFLQYLYSGEMEEKTWDYLKGLYYLADKYDVVCLKNECIDGIISILSVDLTCEILKLAYSYSDLDVKTAAIDFAVNHIKEVTSREDWKELVASEPLIGYEVIVNFIPN